MPWLLAYFISICLDHWNSVLDNRRVFCLSLIHSVNRYQQNIPKLATSHLCSEFLNSPSWPKSQSVRCWVMSDLCHTRNCTLQGSSVHSLSPGRNAGVDCHSHLQGIFVTQGSNPGLSNCRQILYHLSQQGSPMAQEDKIKALSMPHNPFRTSPYLPPQPHPPSNSPPATHQMLLLVLSPTAHGSPCPHFLVILFPLLDLAWADFIYISQTISLICLPPFSKSPLKRLLEPCIYLLSPFYIYSHYTVYIKVLKITIISVVQWSLSSLETGNFLRNLGLLHHNLPSM